MNPFDRDRQKEVKRAEIIRVAGELFCARGFGSVSVEDIAAELQLSKTIVYYYFSSKQALFAACHSVATELMEQAIHLSSDPDRRIHLRGFIVRYATSLAGNANPGAVLLDVEILPEPERTDIVARRDLVYEKLRKLIEAVLHNDKHSNVDPKLGVLVLMSALNLIPRWFRSNGEWTPEQVGRCCELVFMGGLLGAQDVVRSG